MFRERKTFTLLSLLSALVVASTAFVGVSIYAQTGDSELTTFEEEALAAGEQFEDTSNATSDNATEDGSTSTADVSFLEGLVVCGVGTAEVTGETEVASFDESTTPTVSVTVMSETEVAELSADETETASADPARCIMTDGGDSDNATDTADATPDAGDATPMNATGDDNATSTSASESETASTPGSDEEILVIEGQDFASGQVVLMFTEDALVGIDDVDENGEIEAKIPMPGGETAVAGETATELRFLESGTQRTATFEFDGETLTAAAGGEIDAEGEDGGETTLAPAPSNSTSTNSTSSSNSTNSTMQ